MSCKSDAWTPEMREKRSAEMKAKWKDPSFRERLVEGTRLAVRTPTHRERARLSHLGKKHSEETKRKISEGQIGKKMSKESIEKRCAKVRGRKLTREHREKLATSSREYWSNPANREKARRAHLGKKHTPEEKQKISEGNIGKTLSEETKRKLSEYRGPKSSMWKGGISFEPYCPKFNKDLKRRVRDFFDNRCVICGKTKTENGKNLHVHHVEYDKTACCNRTPVHFVALCGQCHSKTNGHRGTWESMLHRAIDEIWEGRSYFTKEEYGKINSN